MTNDFIKRVINESLNNLTTRIDFPVFNKEEQRWKADLKDRKSDRPLTLWLETIEGKKLPLKWCFIQLFGEQNLSSAQMKNFFNALKFKTGSMIVIANKSIKEEIT